MKIILTGATGAAGSQILRDLASDVGVESVKVLSRRPLPSWLTDALPKTDKISNVVVEDFLNYPTDVRQTFAEHDACIWALGTSSNGMSEEAYTKVTYDYVVSMVSALEGVKSRPKDKPFRFIFFSGEGADPTEKSMMMFGRIKGRTERFLSELPPESGIKAHNLRPGFFYPKWKPAAQNTWTPSRRFISSVIGPVVSGSWRLAIPVTDLSKFAIEAAKGGHGDSSLYTNYDMRKLLSQK
ncbi:hypothetical protein K435DRAFT_650390 [Dendrothele bispora CBS 962.96]|uniref:NAD(P)-binding domain-containing protein n=1 Tax=Dendrothele bispora (strain CBS 962.96) TaxID=1314807 RepID=A0A4S8MM24_DENBC|nr:hypothetical protein K435DRAFT_650390 [Dendrothele bispora CBS 962.96]